MSIKARTPRFKQVTKNGLRLVRVEPILQEVGAHKHPITRVHTPHVRRKAGAFKLWYWGPKGYVCMVSTVKSRRARFKDNVRWWV